MTCFFGTSPGARVGGRPPCLVFFFPPCLWAFSSKPTKAHAAKPTRGPRGPSVGLLWAFAHRRPTAPLCGPSVGLCGEILPPLGTLSFLRAFSVGLLWAFFCGPLLIRPLQKKTFVLMTLVAKGPPCYIARRWMNPTQGMFGLVAPNLTSDLRSIHIPRSKFES